MFRKPFVALIVAGMVAFIEPTIGADSPSRPSYGPSLDRFPSMAPPPTPSRPRFVPGEGWTVLVPYRNGDTVDRKTGRIWMRGQHGAMQPSKGRFIPRRF